MSRQDKSKTQYITAIASQTSTDSRSVWCAVILASPPACNLPHQELRAAGSAGERDEKGSFEIRRGLLLEGWGYLPSSLPPLLSHLLHPPPSPVPICILKDLQLLETPTGRRHRRLTGLHHSTFFPILPSFTRTSFLLPLPIFIFCPFSFFPHLFPCTLLTLFSSIFFVFSFTWRLQKYFHNIYFFSSLFLGSERLHSTSKKQQ